MFIMLLFATFIAGSPAKAYSLTGSCEKFLMGIRGSRLAQQANETPLYQLGSFREMFRPVFRVKSWMPIQVRGEQKENQKIDQAAVSERLNALDDDLLNTREVSIYSFVRTGAVEINAYLDEVADSEETFKEAVDEFWRAKMQGASQLNPAVPITGARNPLSLAALHPPQSGVRMVLNSLAIPVLAFAATATARRSQRDRDFSAHLRWVDETVNDEKRLSKAPFAFFSQNVAISVQLFRDIVRSDGSDDMMHTLAKEYMARNPFRVMAKWPRTALSNRSASEKPEVVYAFLDQMFYMDEGIPVLVTYIRARRKIPTEINTNDGDGVGGRRVHEQAQARTMQLVPIPIRVRRGDRG